MATSFNQQIRAMPRCWWIALGALPRGYGPGWNPHGPKVLRWRRGSRCPATPGEDIGQRRPGGNLKRLKQRPWNTVKVVMVGDPCFDQQFGFKIIKNDLTINNGHCCVWMWNYIKKWTWHKLSKLFISRPTPIRKWEILRRLPRGHDTVKSTCSMQDKTIRMSHKENMGAWTWFTQIQLTFLWLYGLYQDRLWHVMAIHQADTKYWDFYHAIFF